VTTTTDKIKQTKNSGSSPLLSEDDEFSGNSCCEKLE
jgi:hypothetical protein